MLRSLYSKFASFFSKTAADIICISWNYNGCKNVSEKSLQGQYGKDFFRKTKKIHTEICNIHHIYFKSASQIYFLGL